MTRATHGIAAAMLLLAPISAAHAQPGSAPHEIVMDAPIHRDIRGDEVHRLSVGLNAGEFAYVSVIEEGVDVSVKLISPTGRLLGLLPGHRVRTRPGR